jgi:CubicO group peptidase (beta-lactamase class C family)
MATVEALPDNPLGAQAQWFLESLARGGPSADELSTHSAPPTREDTTLDRFQQTIDKALEAGPLTAGAWEIGGGTDPSGAQLTIALHGREGAEYRLGLAVESAEPHRITNLAFEPAPSMPPVDWEEVQRFAPPAQAASAVPASLVQTFDESLEAARRDGLCAGLLGMLVQRGEIVYFRGLGYADVASRSPMTERSVVRIGSAAKTCTAMGVLQLRDRGLIDLNHPVDEYLTSYRVVSDGEPVLVRHLLTHTGGIVDPGKWIGFDEGDRIPSLAEFYGGVLRASEPGTKWAYSNHGFATLGQMIEDVGGRPFAAHMVDNLFDPLGMRSSDYVRGPRNGGPVVTPYVVDMGRLVPVPYTDIIVQGAGSVFSTPEDMARYIGLITGSGADDVISRSTLGEMMSPQWSGDLPVAPGMQMQMGFAFIVAKLGDVNVAWHNGGWLGASTAMWTAPERGLGVFLHANTLPHRTNLDQVAATMLMAACDAL